MKYVYPENYIEPERKVKPLLIEEQRAAIKSHLQTYVNNAGARVHIKELVLVARKFAYSNYDMVLHDRFIVPIAEEIQKAWHPVVAIKEEIEGLEAIKG